MPKRKKPAHDELGPNSAGQSGDIQQISGTQVRTLRALRNWPKKATRSKPMPFTEWRTLKTPMSLRWLRAKFPKTTSPASTWTMMNTSPN